MPDPATSINWATAGLTPSVLISGVQTNVGQLVPLGLVFLTLSLGLKYGKRIYKTVRSM
jgi:hypothetical protein